MVTKDKAVQVENVSFSYGQTRVLDSVSLPVLGSGTVTALIGPNGSGKSTLLRCLASMGSFSGSISGPDGLYLPQEPPPPSSLTVFESVLLAKQQSIRGFSALRVSAQARAQVTQVLSDLGIRGLRARTMAELSGGQRQLVSFAQAVVRRPELLLLDEPTSALDLRNQLMLMEKIRGFARSGPAIVVVVVHDLGQAARFADKIVTLHEGRVHSHGRAKEVITSRMLREVYRVAASVTTTNDGGIAIEVSAALPQESDAGRTV